MAPTTARAATVADPRLRPAAVGFAVAAALHNADHFRRGIDTVTAELQVAGYVAMAISALAVVAVLVGHRTAPLVAVAAGFPLAVGFAASHWLPHWSALSDPFVDGGVAIVSVVASLLEIAGALWLGIAGLRVLRAEGAGSAAW